VARLIGDLIEDAGIITGVSSAAGIRIGRRTVTTNRADHSAGCQALLLNSRVETAVCELSATSIREAGLPFDHCQTAVLADSGRKVAESESHWEMSVKCRQVLVDALSLEGILVVNCDDPVLKSAFAPGDVRLLAVAGSLQNPFLEQHAKRGGLCAFVDRENAVIQQGETTLLRRRRSHVLDEMHASDVGPLLAIAAAWTVTTNAKCSMSPIAAKASSRAERRTRPARLELTGP
jgi:hypothetical protein